MRVINVSLNELETKVLMIGFEGENQITQVRIDAAEILTDHPNATPTLIAKPLFGFAYPVIVTKEGTDVVWEIDNSVLSFHGDGEIQLTFTEGTVIAKSYVGRIRIKRSLAVNGEEPDPIETWEQAATAKLAEVDAQIGELEDMVEAAEAAKDEAQDIVDDAAADIQAAGAAQVQVVQAAGEEVLDSIPSDYTELSRDVTDLKSALNDVENGVYYDCELDWSELLTTYPSGWRKGYYSGDVGSAYATNNNSNNYIRSAGSIRLGNGGGMTGDIAYLEFVPPSGYSIQVTEARNSDNVIVSQKGYRNSQANPEAIDAHIVYKFNSECRYVVNVGYFADGDASTKATDTNFTNTIKCKIYKYRSKKLPWTSKLRYFKVPINKKDLFAQTADELIEENVDCVLGLPTSYTNDGKPTKLIFMHHGQSGTVSADNETWYPESSVWPNFVNEYLNAGYAVFDVNGSGAYNGDADTDANHQDYGCPNAIQAVYKAYAYIINNYNIDPHIFVHGSSMGAVLAYSFAKAHSNIVDAIGLFSPALLFLSATGQSDLSQDSLNAIALNYGYSSTAEMVSDGYKNLLQCSPFITFVDSNGTIVEKPYSYNWVDNYEADSLSIKCNDITIPIKIWCGSADTSVNPKNGEALTKALKNTWRTSYFREIQGANHSAGLGANATVRTEAVLWFNRFK